MTQAAKPSPQINPAELDSDIRGSLAALERAALRAREIARQTGTAVVVVRDGQLVRLRPGGDGA